MPRGPRLIVENAFYHIINRGNQKQKIFTEHEDFVKYLQILKHYKRKFNIKLICYCLMPNHIHLLIAPNNPGILAKFMQVLTQTYTLWFNKKYSKVGHLWQGRFKSMVICKDDYFLECVKYIESNPVRANLVSSPMNYLWNSYKERVLGSKNKLLDIPDST